MLLYPCAAAPLECQTLWLLLSPFWVTRSRDTLSYKIIVGGQEAIPQLPYWVHCEHATTSAPSLHECSSLQTLETALSHLHF